MARTVAIGLQDFEKVRTRNVFYVDKTDFIREWWENGDVEPKGRNSGNRYARKKLLT